MKKLYWRIKKNGKWTWVPATYEAAYMSHFAKNLTYLVDELEEQE